LEQPAELYLQLMKSCLTNAIYGDVALRRVGARTGWKRWVVGMLESRGVALVRPQRVDRSGRLDGREWLPDAHTMIGVRRLDHLQECIERALERNVPGDVIEAGVWRGGASIFMRAVLKAYGADDRTVWVADSFQGLPPSNEEEYPADAGDLHHTIEELAVSLEEVQANFRRYDLLDDQVRFLAGWFRDTLADVPIERLAVIRIDADMYQSTSEALAALYPKLSPGGYVIVDDYALEPCRRAVDDYRTAMGITDEIRRIDWTGIYWLRSGELPSGDSQRTALRAT
jgi:O-methyltransferase